MHGSDRLDRRVDVGAVQVAHVPGGVALDEGMPLPATVCASTKVGVPVDDRRASRRSQVSVSAVRSCPSTSMTSHPKARHLSAIGSMSSVSPVVPSTCTLLRSQTTSRLPSCLRARRPRLPTSGPRSARRRRWHARARSCWPWWRSPQRHADPDGEPVAERARREVDARDLPPVRVVAEDAAEAGERAEDVEVEEAEVGEDGYSVEQPWPLLRMKRSCPGHSGSSGRTRREVWNSETTSSTSERLEP